MPDGAPQSHPSGADAPHRRALDAVGWIVLNLKVGAFSFGTGSVAPIYRRALVVETRALSADQFQDTLTVAQLLPGPSLVSLTMALGTRLFGCAAGAAGVVALCLPGTIWALGVVSLIPMELPLVQGIIAGFAVGAGALLLELALTLEQGLGATHVAGEQASRRKRRCRWGIVLLVAALTLFRVPLLPTVALGTAASVVLELAS